MRKTQAAVAGAVARERKTRAKMIILKNLPGGYDWGWFSREDARMHLQTVDKEHWSLHYKVWLENKGKRVFEPAEAIPGKVLRKLEEAVTEKREFIEDEWTRFMIDQHWLTHTMSGSIITLMAYPNYPGSRFTRNVDLADILRGIYDPSSQLVAREKRPIKPEEVGLTSDMNAIEIWPQKHESRRHHIYLPPILWQD